MSLKDDAARAAVLLALRDRIGEEAKTAREAVLEGLVDAQAELGVHSVDVTLPDGTKIATASLKEGKGRIAVTNEAAFVAWVKGQWPDQIVETVRPAFRTLLLDRLVPVGGESDAAADPTTGDVAAGVAAYPPPERPTTFQIRFADGGRAEVAAQWRDGRLAGVAEVLAIGTGESA